MKNDRFILALLLLMAAAALIPGCRPAPLRGAPGDRVEVVTTIFPLCDMARRLGGERVEVSCLLPPGASPHHYEPTAEQVREASRASLFVYMGGGLDDWAVKTAAAGSDRLRLLNLYEGAVARGWRPPGVLPSGGGGPDGRYNPHLWLDPLTVRDHLCPALTEALVEADPDNESAYRSNLGVYQAELTALDDLIRSALSGLPDSSFISIHAAWHYFAARYGLDEAAVISEFPGQEPPAAWLAELIDLCREHRVRVIAAEPQLSTGVAEMIAHEVGGRVVLLDPLGGPAPRDSYLNLMRYNTAVLKDALDKP